MFEGKSRGVFNNWAKCSEQVLCVKDAHYKFYDTWDEAMMVFDVYMSDKVKSNEDSYIYAGEGSSSSSESDAMKHIKALELEVQKAQEERDRARKKCALYDEVLCVMTSMRLEDINEVEGLD